MNNDVMNPPAVTVETQDGMQPVTVMNTESLNSLAMSLRRLFEQYRSDRQVAEEKWLRNLRQYLGIYDPEIERELSPKRSRAYPRLTRVKCISVQSRLMNLMFPSNERNWKIEASPSPDMAPDDVLTAIQEQQKLDQEMQLQRPVDDEFVEAAVQELANKRAKKLMTLVEDQLEELGGDQTLDYVALNRKVVASGVLYGLGLMRGPFARQVKRTRWMVDPNTGQPTAKTVESYKPMFQFQSIWDYYGDMAAKTFFDMDGHFLRLVMSRAQVRELADRPDFMAKQIKTYLNTYATGNYKALSYETQLRAMGIKTNVMEMKADGKYEIICWFGPVSGQTLREIGVEVPDNMLSEDIEAEVWMIDNTIIKADINQWRKLGLKVRMVHPFIFDEDDTSPIGNGLPNVMRDSQMSICAATRMMLDNAGVVCGPNLEVNMDLLMDGQDITSVQAYKIWYREGMGADAQYPAVRPVTIPSHIPELQSIIELFMRMADTETFVGPATGGDMERGKGVSEPMRTVAGASMLRGDAALPFKDIVRNFDTFTQSVISSIVSFNKQFVPSEALAGDYNVISRGASSLIAKEVRGMQVDNIAATLTEREAREVNFRKLVEMRFAVRDLEGLIITDAEAKRRDAMEAQAAAEQKAKQAEIFEAELRKLLSEAFKNISQGQKNAANADAVTVKTVLDTLDQGLQDALGNQNAGDDKAAGSSSRGA
jgi:hypothetical protein